MIKAVAKCAMWTGYKCKVSIFTIISVFTLTFEHSTTSITFLNEIFSLTLIVPRAWEIGYMQPCIKYQGKSATHFVYFWSRKTPPIHIWNNLHKLQKQGQSLHIRTTSPSTTDCYKNKYNIQFLLLPCISRSATGNFKREIELALGTIRVNVYTGTL